MKRLLLLLCLCIFFTSTSAFSAGEEDDGGSFPDYDPIGRVSVPIKENLLNFGAIYLVQWGFYLKSQTDIIEKHGSFKNWTEYPFSPRFDKDSFEYNIIKHAITGNYYYLFYRSRRYNEKEAFFWTFMSSLAFEFTIETVTERPSYQDIYQTPVFGTIMGIGFDKISRYFHSWDSWYGHGLGYLFNPMTLIPDFARDKAGEAQAMAFPVIDNQSIGAVATYRF